MPLPAASYLATPAAFFPFLAQFLHISHLSLCHNMAQPAPVTSLSYLLLVICVSYYATPAHLKLRWPRREPH